MGEDRDSAPDLFSSEQRSASTDAPLADRMRPRSLEELVGQDDILGPGRPLRLAIEQDTLSSLILWGPPGSGKTSLARLIAAHTKAQFEPFSAVTSGLPELRRLVSSYARRRPQLSIELRVQLASTIQPSLRTAVPDVFAHSGPLAALDHLADLEGQ